MKHGVTPFLAELEVKRIRIGLFTCQQSHLLYLLCVSCSVLPTDLVSNVHENLWQEVSILAKAKQIVLRDGDTTFRGKYSRLGSDGSLIVDLDSGETQTFYSAEIIELVETISS